MATPIYRRPSEDNFPLLLQDATKHAISSSPLSRFLAEQLDGGIALGKKMVDQVIWNVPKAAVAVGLGVAANYFAAKKYPVYTAAAQPAAEGALNVAKFVGLAFVFKSALNPYLKNIAALDTHAKKLQATAVRYLCPLSLALMAAHLGGIPVKLLESTVYTVGLFGLVKLVSKGLKAVLNGKSSEHEHLDVNDSLTLKKHIHQLIWNFPVMCFFTGMGIAANSIAGKYCPLYKASESPFEIAKFVGLAALFKSILTPYLEEIICLYKYNFKEDRLQAAAVLYMTPIAITVIAAHVWGLKVKTAESALYTVGLFGLIKVLGMSLKAVTDISWVDRQLDKLYK